MPWARAVVARLKARNGQPAQAEHLSALDAEQVMLDVGGSLFRLRFLGSLMEMRFPSSCTNVSRM